jgi:spore germination protein KB
MRKSNRLGAQELYALLLITVSSLVYFSTPRYFFLIAGNAAWLALSIAISVSLICIFIVNLLLKRRPGQNLISLNTQILGTWLGNVVNMLLVGHYVVTGALIIRLFGEAIVLTSLRSLPVSVIMITSVLFGLYGCSQGWNVIAKSCWISLPFIALSVFIPLVLAWTYWEPSYLLPFFGKGVDDTLFGGVFAAGVMGDIILTALLANAVQPQVNLMKVSISAMIVTGLIFMLVVVANSMVNSYPVAAYITIPYFSLARTLSFGRFLERLESVIFIIWVFAALLKIAVMIGTGIYVYKQIFNIADTKPLLLPYGAILMTTAIMPKSFPVVDKWSWIYMRSFGFVITLILPTLIALIGLIKLRGKQEVKAQP